MAILRHVWTGYCGSCIKVCRENWGRGTKKVKPFAHTRVSNWFIISMDSPASGLDTTWQRTLVQTGSLWGTTTRVYTITTYWQVGCFQRTWQSFRHVAPALTEEDALSNREMFLQTCITGWGFWLYSFYILQLPPLSHRETKYQHILGSRLLSNSSSGRCAWLHGG